MGNWTRAVASGLFALMVVGCTTLPGFDGKLASTGSIAIRTWMPAEPLEGDIPVGRWECFPRADYAAMRRSNAAWPPDSCRRIASASAIEIRPDGVGWTLSPHDNPMLGGGGNPPDTAFSVEGSDLLYTQDREFRWSYGDGRLLVQTTKDEVLTAAGINDDVMEVSDRWASFYLLRIGSPSNSRLREYLSCVEDNRGRKLFDVEDCGVLPEWLTR